MTIEYKEIKKDHNNLGEFLNTLSTLTYEDWDKYEELFEGIKYDSWEEFESAMKELKKYLEDNEISSYPNSPLYRGQRCGRWGLETTLERYTVEEYTIKGYLKLIQLAKSVYEQHFDKSCGTDEINLEKIKYKIGDPHPYYQTLVYVRHLGFPSPLLDWTRSFYVAAYFAFCNANWKEDDFVAIYTYTEYFGKGKGFIPTDGFISRLGNNIQTHKRHDSQQAEYTCALKLDETSDEILEHDFESDCDMVNYINHYDTIKESMSGPGNQDVCVKHLIPIKEKDRIINLLYLMNINEYTLFHTEESLMSMVAYDEMKRKRHF